MHLQKAQLTVTTIYKSTLIPFFAGGFQPKGCHCWAGDKKRSPKNLQISGSVYARGSFAQCLPSFEGRLNDESLRWMFFLFFFFVWGFENTGDLLSQQNHLRISTDFLDALTFGGWSVYFSTLVFQCFCDVVARMKRATMSPTFFDSIFQNKFSTYIRIGIRLISIKDLPLGILQSSKVKKLHQGNDSIWWFFLSNGWFQPPTRYGKLSSSFCKKPQISHVFFRRYICEPYLGHTEIRKSLKKSTDWYRECSVFQDTRSWWNVRLVSCLHVRPAVENDPFLGRVVISYVFNSKTFIA